MTASPPQSDVALAALARLRVDFAHNLGLLAQRDTELDRLVAELEAERAHAASWRTACSDARREADAWRLRCDALAAAEAAPASVVAAAVDARGVQTEDWEDAAVTQLRDANAALKRTIAAMRARAEGGCALGQPCACAVQLERCRRHVTLLEMQREALMEACNAMRCSDAAVAGGLVEQQQHVPVLCHHVAVQTADWAPPRHADAEAELRWRGAADAGASAPPSAGGVVGTQVVALPRGLGVPASAKETASQAGVRAALQRRRERKRLGTAVPRERNWAVMD